AGAAQSDALVQQAIVADLGGLSDDDSHPVVDEEAAPDIRARVDLDPGKEAVDLGDEARQDRNAPAIELMSHPVPHDGVEAGIAQQDFQHTPGRRILAKDGLNLLPDGLPHKGSAPA